MLQSPQAIEVGQNLGEFSRDPVYGRGILVPRMAPSLYLIESRLPSMVVNVATFPSQVV